VHVVRALGLCAGGVLTVIRWICVFVWWFRIEHFHVLSRANSSALMQLGFLTSFQFVLTIFACSFIVSAIGTAVLYTIDIRKIKHAYYAAICAHGIAVLLVKNME